MENYRPHASYALLEKGADGWIAEHQSVPYGHQLAAEAALKRGREDWAHYLNTGRGYNIYMAFGCQEKTSPIDRRVRVK